MTQQAITPDAFKDSIGALKDLLPYLWRQKGLLGIGIAGLLIGTVLSFALGLMIRYVIEQFPDTPEAVSAFLDQALVVGIGYFLVVGATGFVAGYCLKKVAAHIARDVRVDVFRTLIRKDFAYLDQQSSGDMQTRIIADASAVGRFLAEQLPAIASAGLALIVGVAGALYISPDLTLMVLICLPFIFIPVGLLSKTLRRIGAQIQASIANTGALGGEVFRNIKLVRAYGKERYEDGRFEDSAQSIVSHAMRGIRLQLGMSVLIETTAMCAFALLLWSAGNRIATGGVSFGQLVAFAYFALMIIQSGGRFLKVATSLNVAVGTTRKVIEYLKDRRSDWTTRNASADVTGTVEFRNVSFAYPTRPDTQVLKGVSLAAQGGEHLALVGLSGAGKSTLFELLLRIQDGYSGEILIDGRDIREFDQSALRATIGYVPQKESLISGSVFDNIGYGTDAPTLERVQAAAKLAHAHEFIEKLPDGYQTDLGEVGGKLSGGQKQRIALARALIRDPQILLLDEAKSALDAQSERLVAAAIDDWARARGATVISIAHQLATVQKADQIAVVSDGIVVDAGTHKELMETSNLYQRLADAEDGAVSRPEPTSGVECLA